MTADAMIRRSLGHWLVILSTFATTGGFTPSAAAQRAPADSWSAGAEEAAEIDTTGTADALSAEWLEFDHHLRTQIKRSRIYGGVLAAGGVLAITGFVGTAANFFGNEARANGFAVTGIIGASFFITGAVGLIVSGVRRRRIRAHRDALVAAPVAWRTDPGERRRRLHAAPEPLTDQSRRTPRLIPRPARTSAAGVRSPPSEGASTFLPRRPPSAA